MSPVPVDAGSVTATAVAPPSSAGATSGSQESITHRLHLPWWPEGDPGKLREAASAYRTAASALTDAAEQGQRGIHEVTGANRGEAIDQMAARWLRVYYGGLGLSAPEAGAPAFDNAIATCQVLAAACDQYADEIDSARHRLEELAAELVAGLVVGGLLTFVTGGLSDAAAAANAARVASEALDLAATLESILTVAFRIGGFAIQGALVGAGSDLAMQGVRASMGDQASISGSELLHAAEFGGVSAPVLAVGAGGIARGVARQRGITDLSDMPGEFPWTGPGPDPAARRVTLRAATKQAIQDNQLKTPDGLGFFDERTGEVIPRDSNWQYGHRPGHEWWRVQNQARREGWTRQQVIEHQNDPSHYQIQSQGTNIGHAGEQAYGAGASSAATDLVDSAHVAGGRASTIADVLDNELATPADHRVAAELDALTTWADNVGPPAR